MWQPKMLPIESEACFKAFAVSIAQTVLNARTVSNKFVQWDAFIYSLFCIGYVYVKKKTVHIYIYMQSDGNSWNNKWQCGKKKPVKCNKINHQWLFQRKNNSAVASCSSDCATWMAALKSVLLNFIHSQKVLSTSSLRFSGIKIMNVKRGKQLKLGTANILTTA